MCGGAGRQGGPCSITATMLQSHAPCFGPYLQHESSMKVV